MWCDVYQRLRQGKSPPNIYIYIYIWLGSDASRQLMIAVMKALELNTRIVQVYLNPDLWVYKAIQFLSLAFIT